MHTPQRNDSSAGYVPGIASGFRGRGRGYTLGRGRGRGRGYGGGGGRRGYGRGRGRGRGRGPHYGSYGPRHENSNNKPDRPSLFRVENGFSFYKKSFLEDPWLPFFSSRADNSSNHEQILLRGIDTLQGVSNDVSHEDVSVTSQPAVAEDSTKPSSTIVSQQTDSSTVGTFPAPMDCVAP